MDHTDCLVKRDKMTGICRKKLPNTIKLEMSSEKNPSDTSKQGTGTGDYASVRKDCWQIKGNSCFHYPQASQVKSPGLSRLQIFVTDLRICLDFFLHHSPLSSSIIRM
jgi:hypothetical protein